MKKNFNFQKLFDDQENYMKCYMKKRYKIVNTVIQIIKLCLEIGKEHIMHRRKKDEWKLTKTVCFNWFHYR